MKFKNFVHTICDVHVYFVHVVNLYVHVMHTLTNVQVIFSGLVITLKSRDLKTILKTSKDYSHLIWPVG